MHSVFGEFSAKIIGWPQSPFQLEVAFASLGFALVGFLAFSRRADLRVKFAAVLGVTPFLWGAAGGHVYQLLVNGDHAAGNSGIILWSDILLPVFGLVAVYAHHRALARTPEVGRHEPSPGRVPRDRRRLRRSGGRAGAPLVPCPDDRPAHDGDVRAGGRAGRVAHRPRSSGPRRGAERCPGHGEVHDPRGPRAPVAPRRRRRPPGERREPGTRPAVRGGHRSPGARPGRRPPPRHRRPPPRHGRGALPGRSGRAVRRRRPPQRPRLAGRPGPAARPDPRPAPRARLRPPHHPAASRAVRAAPAARRARGRGARRRRGRRGRAGPEPGRSAPHPRTPRAADRRRPQPAAHPDRARRPRAPRARGRPRRLARARRRRRGAPGRVDRGGGPGPARAPRAARPRAGGRPGRVERPRGASPRSPS